MTSFAKNTRNATVGALAVFYTALTFGAAVTPAPALAGEGPYYRAEFAQPVEAGTEIVRGTPWTCAGNVCVAPKSNSRPVIVCQRAAGEFGDVTSFTVEGEDLAEDKLAKCQGDD